DDPEACVHAVTLAMEYRAAFKRDVIVDLVCYRRHGHNELDDPTFTQPVMYATIARHVPVSRGYPSRLVEEGVLAEAEKAQVERGITEALQQAHQLARGTPAAASETAPAGTWSGLEWAGEDWTANTAVPRERLEQVIQGAALVRADFHPHR